jgi:hypothetical protein
LLWHRPAAVEEAVEGLDVSVWPLKSPEQRLMEMNDVERA